MLAARRKASWQETFSVPDALRRADEILSRPPEWPWVERIPPRGELVFRAVLPLELCQPQNRKGQAWLGAAQREQCYRLLARQARTLRFPEPLSGRPFVRAIRFSCVPTDAYADSFKLAIDRLCAPRSTRDKCRLGLIHDDSPRYADVRQWGEKAPRGQGLGLIEVWTG